MGPWRDRCAEGAVGSEIVVMWPSSGERHHAGVSVQPRVRASERNLPSASFLKAWQLLMRRCSGDGSEDGCRGLGPPFEMIEDLFDHRRIFDARGHLDRTAAVIAELDIDLKHPLQTLRPRHRHVGRGCRFVGGLSLAPATSGRRHLLTQSMIRREHPEVAREIDPRRRHQGGQARPSSPSR